MADVFPTALFGFLSKEIDVERQTITGGQSLSGESDTISSDGGGRVFADFSSGALVDRSTILAWRAVVGILEEGVNPVVVPFCEIRYQPYGALHAVPHSDDTPFSDDSLYSGGATNLPALAPAALRATSISVDTALLPQALLGGEWFAIDHPGKGWRAYKVRRILSPTSVQFVPPLREAVDAGDTLDFTYPRCLMVAQGRPNTRIEYGRQAEAAIRFVEAP